MANVDAKVPELREKFLKKYEGSILDDTFDERDVEEIKTTDALLRNALRAFKSGGDVNKATDLLNEVLEFRAKMKLRDMKDSDLNAELKEKNGIYFHGTDNEGRKIVHFRVCKQKKGHLVAEARPYLSYFLYQHYKENPEQQVVFLFDFVDAGVSNMDMDVTKYIIKSANTYFPNIAAYNLMFKMGIALEAIWKIIQTFLDADMKKKTYFVSRKDVQKYVPAEQLMAHMIKEDKK